VGGEKRIYPLIMEESCGYFIEEEISSSQHHAEGGVASKRASLKGLGWRIRKLTAGVA